MAALAFTGGAEMRLFGSIRVATGGASHSPTSDAFGGMRRCHKTRNMPAGTRTRPPPLCDASSSAFWIEAVQSVFPSPTAPKAVTLKSIACALTANAGSSAAQRSLFIIYMPPGVTDWMDGP
jgi:hypothetical protein